MIKETDVIHHVLNGDVNSFRLLMQRYQKPVISMINNIINDQQMCEDIAQDVFFTAYKKLSSFDSARSNFSTWLFTIARNKSLNTLKKKRALFMSQLPEKADLRNPSDELGERELFDKFDSILQTLPAKQKTAFVLAEFQKLSYAEIAHIEGVRIGTIKSRINRAKRKLAKSIKDFVGDRYEF